jgi:hypothetical protein
MQCNLNFADRPEEFQTGNHKVVFALSFLRGIAQSWFEPGLDVLDLAPAWYNDWDVFVGELRTNFGPHDAVGDAENAIGRLRMKDSARITSYIVEFNSLAILLSWGDAALRHRFYEGLPPRLKDDVSRGDGKPATLAAMRVKAQQCDARYWERRAEIIREGGNDRPRPAAEHRPSSSFPSPKPRPQQPQPNRFQPRPFQPKPPAYGINHKNRASFQPSPSRPSTSNDLTGKLTKDGKLTEAEKQRRRDKNLCLWCGAPGHMANVCPLNTRARAVRVAGPSDSAKAANESKN